MDYRILYLSKDFDNALVLLKQCVNGNRQEQLSSLSEVTPRLPEDVKMSRLSLYAERGRIIYSLCFVWRIVSFERRRVEDFEFPNKSSVLQ